MEKETYMDLMLQISKLRGLFLKMIARELGSLGIRDVNETQAMLIYTIGLNKGIKSKDLSSSGFYSGHNVSYNIGGLVKEDYVKRDPDAHDQRANSLELTLKGLHLYRRLDSLFEARANALNGSSNINALHMSLLKLERFLKAEKKKRGEI